MSKIRSSVPLPDLSLWPARFVLAIIAAQLCLPVP